MTDIGPLRRTSHGGQRPTTKTGKTVLDDLLDQVSRR